MLKREIRLRREYLHKKAIQQREQTTLEKKRIIKQHLDASRRLPTELKHDAAKLMADLPYDEHLAVQSAQDAAAASADDEYSNFNGAPRVVITTSRDPSSKLLQFAKELKLLIPESQRINRGKHVIKEIVKTARLNGFTDLILLHEHRGNPNGMVICHLPHGPTAYFSLSNVTTRHSIAEATGKPMQTMSQAYPQLIFNNFTTKLGNRFSCVLQHLFPQAKPESQRIMTFSNTSDFISFRHHMYRIDHSAPAERTKDNKNDKDGKDGKDSKDSKDSKDGGKTATDSAKASPQGKGRIELAEVGPRFDLRPYRITLGTLEQDEADDEWILHAFMNSTRNKDAL